MRHFTVIIFLFFSVHESIGQQASSPYQLNLKKELAYIGGGATLTTTGFILEREITPYTAQEIDQLSRPSIWKWDGAAMYNYSAEAALASDYLKFIGWATPLAFAIPKTTRKDFWTIGVMGAETVLITAGLTSVFKGAFQRTRPFVYNDVAPLDEKIDVDARKSFFSGHTSNYSAISFFTAKVISDYSSNQTVEVIAWSLAGISSGFMGYLRMRSGKHFLTDVATGYVVGAAIGIAIPQLHKADRDRKFSISPYYDLNAVGFNVVAVF